MEVSEMHHKIVRMATAAIFKQAGFDHVDVACIDTLTKIVKNLMCNISARSRLHGENSGRSQPAAVDVVAALTDLQIPVTSLHQHVISTSNQSRLVVPPPKAASSTAPATTLQVGSVTRPPYIPESLPPFPDPHTFVVSQVSVDADPSYPEMRDSMARQRHNVEQCLVNFTVNMMPDHSHRLFPESDEFRVLCLRLRAPTTISALVASSQAKQSKSSDVTRTSDTPGKVHYQHSRNDNTYLRPPQMPSEGSAPNNDDKNNEPASKSRRTDSNNDR